MRVKQSKRSLKNNFSIFDADASVLNGFRKLEFFYEEESLILGWLGLNSVYKIHIDNM